MAGIGFLGSLERFNKDAISDETIELLYPYLAAPDFTAEDAKKVAGALAGLCTWSRAMTVYGGIAKNIKPKKEALKLAEGKLRSANAKLAKAQLELDALQAALDEALANKQAVQEGASALEAAAKEEVTKQAAVVAELEAQLNAGVPAMEKAEAALNGLLSMRDIGELKGLGTPPAATVKVTEALAYMLAPKGTDLEKVDVTWGGAKMMMGDVQKFIERLQNFDVAEFPMKAKAKVLEYTGVTSDGLTEPNNPEFNY
eukprot:3988465-Prymnesium_polylepis.1